MTSLRYLIAKALPLVATIGMCLTALVSCVAVAGEFRVGAAEVKITPPLGTPLAGYLGPRFSEGVLDELYAKANRIQDQVAPDGSHRNEASGSKPLLTYPQSFRLCRRPI